MSVHNWNRPRNITIGALLAAISVAIQASPLYLPLVGISLSALSTLPVAVAGYLNGATGVFTFLISGAILCFWSVPQALVFLFSSGLLGLCLGILIKKRYHFLFVAGICALVLTGGFLVVGKLLGIPILPWLTGTKRLMLAPVLLFCSFIYSAIWVPVLNAFLSRLEQHLNF